MQVFIIDDSLTMSRLWKDVLPVFDVLAYIVKSADPDGIDLYFTMTGEIPQQRLVGTKLFFKTARCCQEQNEKDAASFSWVNKYHLSIDLNFEPVRKQADRSAKLETWRDGATTEPLCLN